MQIGNKIGEGKYRECFEIEGTDLCAKKIKSKLYKSLFGIKLDTSNLLLNLFFDYSELNYLDYNNIVQFPSELKTYIPEITYIDGEYLVMNRPKDYDGEYSKTLEQYGKVDNQFFNNHVLFILKIFLERNLYYFDILRNGNNIIVQKLSETEYKPIIIDFKVKGKSRYIFQFNLLLKSELKRKLLRRFGRFKKKYLVNI